MRRSPSLLLLGLIACRPPAPRSHMATHYQRVQAVRMAVLTGDLETARAGGRWLAEHEQAEGLGEGASPHDGALRAAAREVGNARDVREAAMATGRMGVACGACHEAMGRGPRMGDPGPAPAGSDTVVTQQMALHLWAADRMWEGLTGPSDPAWARGAISLADVPRFQRHVRRVGLGAAAADSLAQRLHALSQRAALIERSGRAEVYGQLLGTCATCHQGFGVRLPRQGRM